MLRVPLVSLKNEKILYIDRPAIAGHVKQNILNKRLIIFLTFFFF